MNNQIDLGVLLYQMEITVQDIATFIAVQFQMEQAGIRIVDLDPGTDEVELRWQGGRFQEWLSLSEAINMIDCELENYRKEAEHDASSSGH